MYSLANLDFSLISKILVIFTIICLLSPLIFLSFNLITSFCFYLYKLLNYSELVHKNPRKFWHKPFSILTKFWYIGGYIWHGYEIIGIDKIPEGPALLIFYHPMAPLDAALFLSKYFQLKKRKILCIVDRMVNKIPGYKTFVEALEHEAGTIQSCVSILKRGDLLMIYPGGIKEVLHSDNTYNICWKEKCGFATIALESKVPIIPIFTQNCRELCITFESLRGYFQRLYARTKIGYALVYGWFPVKLRTIIGDPIYYDQYKSMSNEEIVSLTKSSLEDLIKKHQRIPGSIRMALLDRFRSFESETKSD